MGAGERSRPQRARCGSTSRSSSCVRRFSMLEQELKLSVDGTFAPTFPVGHGDVAGVEELPPLDLRAAYYDTPDLRLARSGVTLRRRTGEGEGPVWTVKLPAGEGIA